MFLFSKKQREKKISGKEKGHGLAQEKDRKVTETPSDVAEPTKRTAPRNLDIVVLPVAVCEGQRKKGVEEGPGALLKHGLVEELVRLGHSVHVDNTFYDHDAEILKRLAVETKAGDRELKKDTETQYRDYCLQVSHAIAEVVALHQRAGKFVLTLGGDHSIGYGTVSGSAHAHPNDRLGVLWVDAHADINTPDTSMSGNMHGCPVAYLTNIAANTSAKGSSLSCKKVAYVGLRDVDTEERKFILKHEIFAKTASDITANSVCAITREALEHLGDSAEPVHMSFDIDVLDPSEAPATGTPVRGGMTLREARLLCEQVHESGRLVAMDLVEVNPMLATSPAKLKRTLDAALTVILAALGHKLL